MVDVTQCRAEWPRLVVELRRHDERQIDKVNEVGKAQGDNVDVRDRPDSRSDQYDENYEQIYRSDDDENKMENGDTQSGRVRGRLMDGAVHSGRPRGRRQHLKGQE